MTQSHVPHTMNLAAMKRNIDRLIGPELSTADDVEMDWGDMPTGQSLILPDPKKGPSPLLIGGALIAAAVAVGLVGG